MATGSGRAKDNATKALNMLNEALPNTPAAIPPTSPVDHVTATKPHINSHAIRVGTAGPALATYGE